MKVYCDRLATVVKDNRGNIPCPKCKGVCVPYDKSWLCHPFKADFDCSVCRRLWAVVPDHIETAEEAEAFLNNDQSRKDEESDNE